jgi:hypothetical protein
MLVRYNPVFANFFCRAVFPFLRNLTSFSIFVAFLEERVILAGDMASPTA